MPSLADLDYTPIVPGLNSVSTDQICTEGNRYDLFIYLNYETAQAARHALALLKAEDGLTPPYQNTLRYDSILYIRESNKHYVELGFDTSPEYGKVKEIFDAATMYFKLVTQRGFP
ncbi:MAG TPA: hypothetical protein VLE89_07805 [Chlamydiales bacterium]|nr:hypothetical protein [Chlamydiales bacterium]